MISVFTPFHKTDTKFLKEAYESLLAQTYTDWEWVILLNGEARFYDIEELIRDAGGRINFAQAEDISSIGHLKKICCEMAKGSIYCEMDYDDILTPNCLQEIHDAFQDESIQMVYSNACEFHDGTWEPNSYSSYWGWKQRDFEYKGHKLIEMISFPPEPQSFRRIEWSPNHVRAWRTSAYNEIGGHDAKLKVGDDHDLCCRFFVKYGAKGIKHIDKCLYLQRVHDQNNTKLLNAEIQSQTALNQVKYSQAMADKWAEDNNLLKLDLGGRFDTRKGYKSVDLLDCDIVADLNGVWPFEDNSVGVIKASHVFEHLTDSINTMNEAYRVLAPGGMMFIELPSTDGRGSFQDPTHVHSFWNSNSFWYYCNESHARFIRPMYKGRFQCTRVVNFFPSEFEKMHNIVILQADLIALKEGYSPCGEVLI
jgi:O-antigen biosynthesis protein